MLDLTVFTNEEFGEVRTMVIEGEPWFVGKDVAASLGYAEPRSAISKKVDAEDKGVAEMATPSGKQKMTIINESGLYSLIFGSKLESATRFKRWVTKEVLPSIRKTGGYKVPTSPAEQIKLLATGFSDHESRIENLEQNMVIDYGQQQTLRKHVNRVVLDALGGKNTEAYHCMSKKVFSECNRDLQDRFKVNSRNNIPRKRYEEAVDYVDSWTPSTNTKLEIQEANCQQRFAVLYEAEVKKKKKKEIFSTSKEDFKKIGIELTDEQYDDLCQINLFMMLMPDIPVYNVLLILKTLGLIPTEIPDNESGNDGDDNSAKNSHEEFERKFGKIK